MRDNLSSGALTETSLLILLSLYEELHGYGVKLHIENLTNNRVKLGMGTLYGALNNMLEKKWIKESSKEGRRINYIITDVGKEQVEREQIRLTKLLDLVETIKGDYHEKI
ncbi:MAG: PadR family transcriptional regulator [Tissierellia bacterium]|nr:PadR family transcriptional regulator [Tissierellia bacterium]